jgi:hypothetical protein
MFEVGPCTTVDADKEPCAPDVTWTSLNAVKERIFGPEIK